MWFLGFRRREEWVRRFGASPPMRMTASWLGSLDPPNTRLWRDCSVPGSGLPSDRLPDRSKHAVGLEAVKVWPGGDRPAARSTRRPTLTAPARAEVSDRRSGTKKRAFGSNKETDQEKM